MDAGRYTRDPRDNRDTDRVADGRPEGAGAITFARAAEQLLDNGYEPIPIKPGQKVPALSRWSAVAIGAAEVDLWAARYPDHGVGLRTGHLVGLDIDLLDPDRAHDVACRAEERFGATPMRVGQWPKRLLLYRTDAPIRKLAVPGVEVLGVGQQFVAFGTHPGTGQPYAWPLGETPLEVALADLPTVTGEALSRFLGEIGAALPPRPASGSRASTGAAPQTILPERDAFGLVVDGRDAWLSTIAFHTVHDALEHSAEADVDAIAEAAWARFRASAELGRPRGGGAMPYGIADARRKVADKLRLHAEGALPTRTRKQVSPDYSVPILDAAEARERLRSEIESFCEETFRWHMEDHDAEPPRRAIRATVGLGKSAISRKYLIDLQSRLRDEGRPHRIVVFVASHALAQEAAGSWLEAGAQVVVLKGYERMVQQSGRPMCRNIKAVKAAIANRRDIQQSACRKNLHAQCRYFVGCPKQENRRQIATASVVVAPYDAMFQKLAGAMNDVGIVVVDEGCWQRAPAIVPDLTVRAITEEFLSPGRPRSSAKRQASVAADLQDLRSRARKAFEESGTGPIRRSAILGAGLDQKACEEAAAFENNRLKQWTHTAGLDQGAFEEALGEAAWNERVFRWIDFWQGLAQFLESGKETSPLILVGDPHADTGDRPIRCSRLRQMAPEFRCVPCLHLDATYRTELATPVLGPGQEVAIEAKAPGMSVTLVTGSFGKSRLGKGLVRTQDDRTSALPGSLLAQCVDYVRFIARIHAPGDVLVVTNKVFEPAFYELPGVQTAHFNAVAGIDGWKNVRALIVIGRPLPRDNDLAALVGVHLGAVSNGRYRLMPKGLWMRDGTVRTIKVIRHEDEASEVIRAAICDDELIQVIGRGRGVNRTVETPLDVHILADVVLPLEYDNVVDWEAARLRHFEYMLLAGPAVDSPGDAAALHPHLFSSADQSRKAFQRALFKGHIPYILIRGLSLKSARYRRSGRGRSWQRVWWIEGDAAATRQRLTAALGDLAEWIPGSQSEDG